MRFSALLFMLCTLLAAACAAPLDAANTVAPRHYHLDSIAAFNGASDAEKKAFLMSINPATLHLPEELRRQIEESPAGKKALGGKKFTDEMAQTALRQWQESQRGDKHKD